MREPERDPENGQEAVHDAHAAVVREPGECPRAQGDAGQHGERERDERGRAGRARDYPDEIRVEAHGGSGLLGAREWRGVGARDRPACCRAPGRPPRRRGCWRRCRGRDGRGLERRFRGVQVLAREDRHAAEAGQRDRGSEHAERERRTDQRSCGVPSIGHVDRGTSTPGWSMRTA